MLYCVYRLKLHIVDLDAAFGRPEVNISSIKEIRKSVSIPIQLGGGISESFGIDPMMESNNAPGAWLFAIVKACLVAAIAWLFIEMRVERRQVHMRMLIVLAVLIVGLAPGLRDIGRLTLDV